MTGSTLVPVLLTATFALLTGSLVMLAGVLIRRAIMQKRDSTTPTTPTAPTIAAIFDALTPFLYRAILAGEKIALWSMDQADAAITGMDKAQIANSLYALLPDTLLVDGVTLPVGTIKALVPREVFAAWVKEVYDSAHAFILSNEEYLRAQIEGEKKV